MSRIWKLLILTIAFLLSACTSTGMGDRFGYWLDMYPGNESVWQCVDTFVPHNNKEC